MYSIVDVLYATEMYTLKFKVNFISQFYHTEKKTKHLTPGSCRWPDIYRARLKYIYIIKVI